jgi:hypothetical protein
MLNICVIHEDDKNTINEWSYLRYHFKIDNFFIIGPVDKWKKYRPMKDIISISTTDLLPPIPLILMTPLSGKNLQGNTSLNNFDHPADATYLFGPNHKHLNINHLGTRLPDRYIYIPTQSNDEMYSYIVGAITIYDRIIKNG